MCVYGIAMSFGAIPSTITTWVYHQHIRSHQGALGADMELGKEPVVAEKIDPAPPLTNPTTVGK